MPLVPAWAPPSRETTQKLTNTGVPDRPILDLRIQNLQKTSFLVQFWVPSEIFSLMAVCLWAVGSLSQSVFKSWLRGLDTHTCTHVCARTHTHTLTHTLSHTHRNTINTHTQNTEMGLYGYTDRFGGLECLKKASDCLGVSLRGSTSSFLKQAERRLQRGTREKKRWRLRTSHIQIHWMQKHILLPSWS